MGKKFKDICQKENIRTDFVDSDDKKTWSYSIMSSSIPNNNKKILGVNLSGTNIICLDIDGTVLKRKNKLTKK